MLFLEVSRVKLMSSLIWNQFYLSASDGNELNICIFLFFITTLPLEASCGKGTSLWGYRAGSSCPHPRHLSPESRWKSHHHQITHLHSVLYLLNLESLIWIYRIWGFLLVPLKHKRPPKESCHHKKHDTSTHFPQCLAQYRSQKNICKLNEWVLSSWRGNESHPL